MKICFLLWRGLTFSFFMCCCLLYLGQEWFSTESFLQYLNFSLRPKKTWQMQGGERFILVPNPEIKFKVKRPWQLESGAANHIEFLGRKHRFWCSICFCLSIWCIISTNGMMLPTFRMWLPTSINPVQKSLPRQDKDEFKICSSGQYEPFYFARFISLVKNLKPSASDSHMSLPGVIIRKYKKEGQMCRVTFLPCYL